jgi:8-oxo-dGTP diphosphatase
MENMKQRISAGVMVVQDSSILMVNHKVEGQYDFWVPPGGGVIGIETLQAAAMRELEEEAGVSTSEITLAYIEELYTSKHRECKFWFYTDQHTGIVQTEKASAERESIVDARFIHRDELCELVVFPSVVLEQLWKDIETGFTSPLYLGIHEMTFP